MLIKARFLIQPLEQEGGSQKCCISLCSKVFINHFYRMKASTECLNILIYWSTYWIDILRRTIRRKVYTGIFYQQIYRFCHYILHQVAHIDCSAPNGEQHEPLTGVGEIVVAETPGLNPAGGHFNIKELSYQYSNYLNENKTVLWKYYLYNKNPYN